MNRNPLLDGHGSLRDALPASKPYDPDDPAPASGMRPHVRLPARDASELPSV